MPQGKQTSFSYGEVSKSLQFKSNSVSYAEGLAELTNGFIRSEGGWSNRAGFENIAEVSLASNHTGLKYTEQKYKLGYYHAEFGESYERETLGNKRLLMYSNPTYDENTSPTTTSGLWYYGNINGLSAMSAKAITDFAITTQFPTSERSLGGDPRKCQFTQIGKNIYCTYGDVDVTSTIRNYPVLLENAIKTSPIYGTPFSGVAITSITVTSTGSAPTNLPVAYLAMVQYTDGSEKHLLTTAITTSHPHSVLSNKLSIAGVTLTKDMRSINIYRATQVDGPWSLVGKVPIHDLTVSPVLFGDYVIAGDITNMPPINPRLWGKQLGASIATSYFDKHYSLRTARRIMNYQQRFFAAMDSASNDDEFKEGTVVVSKLGVVDQLHFPDIYNNIDAFEFTIPLRGSDKILHMVPMDRALLFCRENIIMLQGSGENGYITPTEVNPVEIHKGGISEYIEPLVVNNLCLFVSRDHKEIMAVSINNGQYKLVNVSGLSSHLLYQDIVEMEFIDGDDKIVWVLRKDGKLVSITLGSNFGFALHETAGEIISISKLDRKNQFKSTGSAYEIVSNADYTVNFNTPPEERLAALVVRNVNGTKQGYLEVMAPRIDNDGREEGFKYMDSFKEFGAKLVLCQDGRYYNELREIPENTYTPGNYRHAFNIQGGTDYAAGDPVNLRAGVDLTNLFNNVPVTYVDFFYDEEIEDSDDGETITIKRTIRFVKTGTATWDSTDLLVPGYFDQDVPAILQDVETLNPSDKLAKQTRWALPFNAITGTVFGPTGDYPLAHLAGADVSVFADNRVISSPNNPDPAMDTLTVDANGDLALGDYYSHVSVGLPYTTTMQSLNLETSGDRTLTDANKNLNEIGIAFENTRNGYVSHSGAKLDISKFEPLRYRTDEAFDSPDRNYSGYLPVPIQSSWDPKGRTVIKQLDPLPISVNSIYPKGVSSGE